MVKCRLLMLIFHLTSSTKVPNVPFDCFGKHYTFDNHKQLKRNSFLPVQVSTKNVYIWVQYVPTGHMMRQMKLAVSELACSSAGV